MTAEPLFPGYESAVPPPGETLSAGQRLTLRQHRDVSNGRHPLTGTPTHPELGTCGTCRFRDQSNSQSGRTYPKCFWEPERAPGEMRPRWGWPRITSGAATDVRAWWPACADFLPKTEAP
jgi:hypothetical protein